MDDNEESDVALAIRFAAKEIGKEGSGDPRGALEFLAGQTFEGLESVARSLDDVARGLEAIASAIRKHGRGAVE